MNSCCLSGKGDRFVFGIKSSLSSYLSAMILFIFFTCLKKTSVVWSSHTTTERAPVPHGPSDFPVLLEFVGILQTRSAQTVQNPYSTISAVLGMCQWENIIKYLLCFPLRGKQRQPICRGDSIFSGVVVWIRPDCPVMVFERS